MIFTQKTTNVIDYNDLDNAVTEFLTKHEVLPIRLKGGRTEARYECVAYEEWGNYESHPCDVTADDRAAVKAGDDLHFQLGSILNWMCAAGELPCGNYTVEIFW